MQRPTPADIVVSPLVTARVRYHHPEPRRQVYRIDADGVTGRLASPAHIEVEVALHDQRSVDVSFEVDGIAFVDAPVFDRVQQDGSARYDDEVAALLRSGLGATDVHVFDHTPRRDDPQALRRPARNVHTDYSPFGAAQRLRQLLGDDEAARWERGHYAFVNLWRPLSAVVRSAPLAFVRPATVAPSDWVTLDLVYPDRVGQILGLAPSSDHQWLWRSAMTRDEAVLFCVHDNRGRAPVAHSAVDLTSPADAPAVRESLETRTLVRFA